MSFSHSIGDNIACLSEGNNSYFFTFIQKSVGLLGDDDIVIAGNSFSGDVHPTGIDDDGRFRLIAVDDMSGTDGGCSDACIFEAFDNIISVGSFRLDEFSDVLFDRFRTGNGGGLAEIITLKI